MRTTTRCPADADDATPSAGVRAHRPYRRVLELARVSGGARSQGSADVAVTLSATRRSRADRAGERLHCPHGWRTDGHWEARHGCADGAALRVQVRHRL